MKAGAQLYTLRNQCQTLEGFAQSLARVAEMGYRYVQVSGTCAYDPLWLKAELDKNGLQCVITHIPAPRLTGETEKVIEEHDVLDCRHVGLGWWGFEQENTAAGYESFLNTYLPVAKKLREGGKLFMYHNHDQEFIRFGGKTVLDRLIEDVPAELMGFTFDTFWAQAGGADPAQYLEKLAGRIPCIHLKDYAYGRKMAPVGEGNINFDRVLEKAQAGGAQYLLVEQDDTYGEDPFDCLRRSLAYLRACGIEE